MSEEKIIPEAIGSVKISEEVVGIVAGVAAMEVNGVAGMSSSLTGGIAELLGKKNLSKGVKVELGETNALVGISLVVEYGCRIPDVAWEVQEKVKKAIESMTGLEVTKVDVFVNGVTLAKEEKKEEIVQE